MNRTVIIRIAALFLAAAALASTAFPEAAEEFHKTFTLTANTPVTVANAAGTITVSSWDQPYVDVRAVKRTRRGADELKRVMIGTTVAGSLDIRAIYDNDDSDGRSFFSRLFGSHRRGVDVTVDFTVKLPEETPLDEVRSVSGDISVSGTRGETVIHTVSGSVRAADAPGALDISTTSGKVTVDRCGVRRAKSISGSVTIRDAAVNGPVHTVSGCILVERASGTIEAKSTSGGIAISSSTVPSASTISGDMDITVEAAEGPMTFTSVSGDIRLRLPSVANADIEMNTVSGRMETLSEFPLVVSEVSRRGLMGRIGAGGGRIALKTTSGGIALGK